MTHIIESISSNLSSPLHKDWLELFRLVLEIAAVLLGVRAYFDIKKQLDAANGLAGRLTSVSKTLSTRFIGYFPLNFRKILQVLKNANKSVRIMVDYADYGSLTAHDDFLEYVKQVSMLGSKPEVDIRIICYTLDEACNRITLDFGTVDKLRTYRDEAGIRSLLRRKQSKELPLPEVFIKWLLQDQVDVENHLRQNGVQIVTFPNLPLFCWIRDDDEEAVFSFPLLEDPNYPGKIEPFRTSEISFYTRESRIVKTLAQTFDEIYAKSQKTGSS